MVVYEENGGGKEPLTWTQTREDMPLTHRVRRTPHAAVTEKKRLSIWSFASLSLSLSPVQLL
jgi:hypothetical protein